MILARSQSSSVLGIVTGILGAGGILGGILVSLLKLPKDNQKVMYLSAALSFLFGDITMGLGQNVYIWSLGALFASVPIPFILAAQNVMIYHWIPVQRNITAIPFPGVSPVIPVRNRARGTWDSIKGSKT